MKSLVPPEQTVNRNNEESLQRTFEAMLAEIKRMKLDAEEKKKLISLLIEYRTAWNSYMNRIKPRNGRNRLSSWKAKSKQ